MNARFATIGFLLILGCATPRPPRSNAPRPFQFPEDTFAFANQTVFAYEKGQRIPDLRQRQERYSRRCFLMAAAAVQFWKHARFDPVAPMLSQRALAQRIRLLTRRPAWAPVPDETQRLVFPGFSNLHELSGREGNILRANLGPGWTTYFHVRKNVMLFPISKAEQARIRNQLDAWLARAHPLVLWLYNFPSLNINHAVVVYGKIGPNEYMVYDPNFTDAPRPLHYDPQTRSFSYVKTFYFGGGSVKVRPMYLGLLR